MGLTRTPAGVSWCTGDRGYEHYLRRKCPHEVKRRLLVALVDKFQWTMLYYPFPEFPINQKGEDGRNAERKFEWTAIADGVLLSADTCGRSGIESRVEPDWRVGSLPTLSYSDDLRITAKQGEKIVLCRGVAENITWFRHYRQDKDGLKTVPTKEVAFAQDKLLCNA
jgi:hypothetical protein